MAYTPQTMPDVDLLLMEVLRGDLTDVTVVTQLPDDYVTRLPVVVAKVYPAQPNPDPRFAVKAGAQVDAWAASRAGAAALADRARRSLVGSWLNAVRHENGVVSNVGVTRYPTMLGYTGQPAGVVRFHALYLLTVRP